jgi:CGNR zinc finger protein
MVITGSAPVEHLIAVANTYHEPEAREPGSSPASTWLAAHDHLDTADAAIEFLHRHGIRFPERPQARQLARLREIRRAARSLVANRRAYERATGRLLESARFRLDAAGKLTTEHLGWDGFIDGLLIALVELGDHGARVKLCDNQHCRWLFIDHSKNRSRQWCESASCGNRQRVRRFRRRAAA